MAPFDRS